MVGWRGLCLALQFLTVFPLRKEVPWEAKTARWSVRMFPVVGLVVGSVQALVYWLFLQTSVSPLFLALFLLFLAIFLSGGLHADGWMDVSDAFFSYRDKERRLEIMKDSRVGAFAVLSLVFLLSFRFVFLYETIGHVAPLIFIVIPFFSRSFMALLLSYGKLAKPNGMAAAFRKHVTKSETRFILLLLSIGTIVVGATYPVETAALTLGAIFSWRSAQSFYDRQFGGITGDMLGAFVEGTEGWLWFLVWLLRSFVTA
ncbi:adenosylcobinamide-GDP ribazoletransferase [Anoxybacillus voinovskiensis]|uniref:Adenosylcobinamide-GDP ribazoletransferase n=1 Tax=Anoxybacteroides voinovskiense TaxID=230470 RepID=A0A840DN31_9BACL|nr:adenosylcobinamide-GDP ribazoletransferase [Anoxybacillus voinovskiensis]MBB4073045.1 adenosylcobinamide-GDP ribazoletransferase [Anoxybacillus voinovskiensis]GGJ59890.1 adenosylcobinamide-GDP ribazoletransferase [Anoxybacillus voinovskiensis]